MALNNIKIKMTDNNQEEEAQNTATHGAPADDDIVEGDVNVIVDSGRKKKGNSKEYNRAYYHRTKKEVECQFCGRKYGIISGLVRHQRRSNKCAVQRIGGLWSAVRDSIKVQVQAMDPQVEEKLRKIDCLFPVPESQVT